MQDPARTKFIETLVPAESFEEDSAEPDVVPLSAESFSSDSAGTESPFLSQQGLRFIETLRESISGSAMQDPARTKSFSSDSAGTDAMQDPAQTSFQHPISIFSRRSARNSAIEHRQATAAQVYE